MAIGAVGKGMCGAHDSFLCATVQTATAAKILDGDVRASKAIITVEVNNVRMTLDGTTPSATVGLLLQTGHEPLTIEGPDVLANAKFLEAAAAARVQIAIYR